MSNPRIHANFHGYRSDSRGLAARGPGGIRVCLLVLVLASCAGAQSVLDETVATVNGEMIAKSDVLWNLALNKWISPEDFWKPRIQRLMLESVIDQRLILQESSTLPAIRVSDEEIDARINKISAEFATAEDPDRFVRRQALVGLTRERLREMIRDRLRIEKFEDFRFKSFVVVSESELDRYFETEIRPELTAGGVVVTEQEKAKYRQQAEEGVVDEKTLEALEAYLGKARESADIAYFGNWGTPVPAPPSAAAGQKPAN